MTDDKDRIKVWLEKAQNGNLSEKEKEEMFALITTGENDTSEKDGIAFLNKITDSALDGFGQSVKNLSSQIAFIQEVRAGNSIEAVKLGLEIITPKEKDNESK